MIAATAGSAPMPREINAQHNMNSVGLTTSPANVNAQPNVRAGAA